MTHTASPTEVAHQQPPPGPRGHLLWGSLFDIQRDSLAFLQFLSGRHGDIVRYRVGWVRSHLLNRQRECASPA